MDPSILSQAIEDHIRSEHQPEKLYDISQPPEPDWKPIRYICTLANETAIFDLKIFLYTLQLWNKELPTLFLYCTEEVKALELDREYKGQIYYNTSLQQYAHLTRQQMEAMPSRKELSNLFHDFTMEKCSLMKWALSSLSKKQQKYGVVFFDADLCWLGPLPLLNHCCTFGLSAHEIHEEYEKRFGIYNAGCMWFRFLQSIEQWEKACHTSRFFEQAALEDLTINRLPWSIYQFPTQVNYGWWRLFQGKEHKKTLMAKWSIRRHPEEAHSGILIDGEPLLCIHTHWKTTDGTTIGFNGFIIEKLQLLLKQKKVHSFLNYLARLDVSIAMNALRSKKKYA